MYPVLDSDEAEANHSHNVVLTQRIIQEQAQDPVIAGAIKQINATGNVEDEQLKKHAGLHLREGILYRRNRIIVTLATRMAVMDLVHNSFHGGLNRTYEELQKRFYWKGMYGDTVRACERCRVCLENKRSGTRKQPNTYQDPIPISKSCRRLRHRQAMQDQEASTVLAALEKGWFYRHGYLIVLLSDQGRNVDGRII